MDMSFRVSVFFFRAEITHFSINFFFKSKKKHTKNIAYMRQNVFKQESIAVKSFDTMATSGGESGDELRIR